MAKKIKFDIPVRTSDDIANVRTFNALDDLESDQLKQFVKKPMATMTNENVITKDTVSDWMPSSIDLDIPLESLEPAPEDWNFYPLPDIEKIKTIAQSIYWQGQLSPAIVWKRGDKYIILGGHTRFSVLKFLKKAFPDEAYRFCTMKCHVYDDDQIDESMAQYILIMNNETQRAEEAPSLRIKGIVRAVELRKKFTKAHWGELNGEKSRNLVAREFDVSSITVARYYKLRKLIPELISKLDRNEISQKCGLNLSELQDNIQLYLVENYNVENINEVKWKELKSAVTEEEVKSIMNKGDVFKYGRAVLTYAIPKNFERITLAADKKDVEKVRSLIAKVIETSEFNNYESKRILLDLLK